MWRTPEEMAAAHDQKARAEPAQFEFRMTVNAIPAMTTRDASRAAAVDKIMRLAWMCAGEGVIVIEERTARGWVPLDLDEELRPTD